MSQVASASPEGFKPLVDRLLAQIVEAHEQEVEVLRSRLEALCLQEKTLEDIAQDTFKPEDSFRGLVVQEVGDMPCPGVHVVDAPKPICKDMCFSDEPFSCSLPGTVAEERAASKRSGAWEATAVEAAPGPLGRSDELLGANTALQEARKTDLVSSDGKQSQKVGASLKTSTELKSPFPASGEKAERSTMYKWQWMHRTGWRDYKEKEAAQLEDAFQNGDSKARLKSGKQGHHPMEIFFADMLQHDCASRKIRGVQRAGPDPWWPRLRRFCRSVYQSWETGKPRMESFEEFYHSEIHQGHIKDDQGNPFVPSRKSCHEDGPEMERKKRRASAWKRLADSAAFQRFTMFLIMTNAVWIAIETDTNDAQNLLEADLAFVVVENAFCVAFTLEMIVRFLSFVKKRHAFFDRMFIFDSLCTVSMIFEIWLIPLAVLLVLGRQDSTNTSLGLFRLARLLRVTRISRLVQMVPDFVTLLKGLSRSFKPVMVSTVLLSVLVMLFAIVFRSQVKGTWLGQCCWAEEHCEICDGYFYSIPETILTLFYNGTLLDSVKKVIDTIRGQSVFLTLMFTFYIFATNCAMLNMLIGILCGVVAEAKENETERMDRHKLMSRLSDIMDIYDKDGANTLKKGEFDLFVTNPEVKHVLTEFHVDVWNLQTFMDEYAASLSEDTLEDFKGDPAFTFDEILDIVLRLRGGGGASVSDIVSLRRFTGQRLDNIEAKVHALHQTESQNLERSSLGVTSWRQSPDERP